MPFKEINVSRETQDSEGAAKTSSGGPSLPAVPADKDLTYKAKALGPSEIEAVLRMAGITTAEELIDAIAVRSRVQDETWCRGCMSAQVPTTPFAGGLFIGPAVPTCPKCCGTMTMVFQNGNCQCSQCKHRWSDKSAKVRMFDRVRGDFDASAQRDQARRERVKWVSIIRPLIEDRCISVGAWSQGRAGSVNYNRGHRDTFRCPCGGTVAFKAYSDGRFDAECSQCHSTKDFNRPELDSPKLGASLPDHSEDGDDG